MQLKKYSLVCFDLPIKQTALECDDPKELKSGSIMT